jgi:tetratricopeptide (TPR) repeat protein
MSGGPLPQCEGAIMKAILSMLAATTVAAVALLFGGVLAGSKAGGPAAIESDAAAARLLAGFAPGDTAALVAQLEARVATSSRDGQALVLLGLAYQQRARETGRPSFYPRSETVLRRALRLDSGNALALSGLAALAASRHRFGEARDLARRTLAVNPYSTAAWGILGDAEIETGRYRAAFAAFERMMTIKPTASGYARVSYARQLIGRTRPAIEAMRRAVTAASSTPEPAAWAHVHLGNLFAEQGKLAAADHEYGHALAYVPAYGPALAGLARSKSWRGRDAVAVRLWRKALAAQAIPEHAAGLGDALWRLGREEAADHAYADAEALEAAFAANGGQNELETALFDLDHGQHLADALGRARAGWRLRPSVEAEHVLAWALFKNGRCREARAHSLRALRLGTKDWGAMLHRSLIESCLGHERAATAFRQRALAVNRYALSAFGPLAAHRR